MVMPSPSVFGYDPEKFGSWRRGQDVAAQRIIDSKARIVVECLPTGYGKTLIGVLSGKISGRTLYLTRRKGLQTQINQDFGSDRDREVLGRAAAFNVWGQAGYKCKLAEENPAMLLDKGVTVDDGPCHGGYRCEYKIDRSCHYYSAVDYARSPSPSLVVSNYTFWFNQGTMGPNDWAQFDMIVADEAHGLLDELSKFLTVNVMKDRITDTGLRWPVENGADIGKWKGWIKTHGIPYLKEYVKNLEAQAEEQATVTKALVRRIRRYQRLTDSMVRMLGLKGEWVCQLFNDRLTLAPIWPGEYLEKFLFRGAKKVLLMSATIRPKFLDLLSIKEENGYTVQYNENQSTFPVERRPVIMLNGAPRLNFRTPVHEKKQWATLIDNVIRKRIDRNILIHVHSYARRNELVTMSEWGREMLVHDANNVNEIIAKFKGRRGESGRPNILVSQSLSEGWDFPYDTCEVQVIAKLPYADSRDMVIKARMEKDKEYTNYVAMQSVVQMAGRGMRAVDDVCETIVVDGNSSWFFNMNREYAPAWFRESIMSVNVIPEPLPKLEKRVTAGIDTDSDL